jgi:hypothetical protein
MVEEDIIGNARILSSTKLFLGDECKRCNGDQAEKNKNDPKVREYFFNKYKTQT